MEKVKIFSGHIPQLEADVNAWLTRNKEVRVTERLMSVAKEPPGAVSTGSLITIAIFFV